MPRRSNASADLSAVLNANPVLDMDNVYFSDQGWAYRHYKTEDKSRFWDEILVAGEALLDNGNPDTTAAAFGAASPTFETGDSVQAPVLTLGPVSIVTPEADLVNASSGNLFSVITDTEVTDETYVWSLVDEANGAVIASGGTTAEATVTAGSVAGDYTIRCVITSATATDSPLTVEAGYTVLEA